MVNQNVKPRPAREEREGGGFGGELAKRFVHPLLIWIKTPEPQGRSLKVI